MVNTCDAWVCIVNSRVYLQLYGEMEVVDKSLLIVLRGIKS